MRSSVFARSGCAQRLAHLVGHAGLRELRDRRRILLHLRQHVLQRARQAVGHGEAVAGERDRGLQQVLPRQPALLLPGHVQAGDRARHADREMALVVRLLVVLAVLQEHRRVRARRPDFAEVVGNGLTLRRPIEEEAAAADVAGGRVSDGERERGGHRRVHGRAARGQHQRTCVRGKLVRRHHHRLFLAHRLRGGEKRRRHREHGCNGNGSAETDRWQGETPARAYRRRTIPGRAPVTLPSASTATAVDEDQRKPFGVGVRLFEGRGVAHGRGVEDGDVGPHPWAKDAAIGEAHAGGRERGHLAHRLLEADDVLLADVGAEHARKGAVAARVRRALAELRDLAVGADHGERRGQDAHHVGFRDRVEDARGVAVRDDVEHHVGGILDARLLAALPGDGGEVLADDAGDRRCCDADVGGIAAAALVRDLVDHRGAYPGAGRGVLQAAPGSGRRCLPSPTAGRAPRRHRCSTPCTGTGRSSRPHRGRGPRPRARASPCCDRRPPCR